jgi:hypothetical protein
VIIRIIIIAAKVKKSATAEK